MGRTELSIIMPLYNSGKFVAGAVESLLGQSYGDFELIIVNDGSTDGSMDVLSQFKDPRILILQNPSNQGIVYSRNKGLEVATGAYIAPFDSDDVAMPEKFKLQIDFLKKNPRFGMIGSWVKMIDEDGNLLKKRWRLNAKPEQIPAILLFRNYFVQSAVVMRREAIPKGGYRKGFDLVEDWMMWYEIAAKYSVWNLPEYLVKYRVHSQGNSQKDEELMHRKDRMIYETLFLKLGIQPNDEDFECYRLIKNQQPIIHGKLKEIGGFLNRIAEENSRSGAYDQQQLLKVLQNRWLKACFKTRNKIYRVPMDYLSSGLFHFKPFGQ